MGQTINECLDKLAHCCQYSGDFSALEQVRSFVKEAQAASINSAMDACDTIECPNCGAEFSADCECPICKGHWLRHKQHQ